MAGDETTQRQAADEELSDRIGTFADGNYILASQNVQQSAFTGSVLRNKTDFLSLAYAERQVLEQCTIPYSACKILNL